MKAPAHLPADVRTTWDRLDSSADADPERFDPTAIDHLPRPVARWLTRAVEAGSPRLRCVRLTMHGHIKVGRWLPFTAQQVLTPEGFVWAADAGRFGVHIRGFDRYSDGTGEMRWKLAGLVPVMTAADADTTRSAAGRLAGEAMLVPGGALSPEVTWHAGPMAMGSDVTEHDSDDDDCRATATVVTGPFTHEVTVSVDDDGALRSVTLPRWGNPDRGEHREHVFGVEMDGDLTVAGVVLPARLRAGWWPGTDRWADGEFFRATIDTAELF